MGLGKIVEKSPVLMNGWKRRLKGRLETAAVSDISYIFGQGKDGEWDVCDTI